MTTIKIPDRHVQRVVDAFTLAYKYQETLLDENGQEIPNPVNKRQFTKNAIWSFIKKTVGSVEAHRDAEAVRKAKLAQVEQELDLDPE